MRFLRDFAPTLAAVLTTAIFVAFGGAPAAFAQSAATKPSAEKPAAAASSARGGPAIWLITDKDSALWIFGSVHMLPPGLKWRHAKLEGALAAADIVYFEAPTDRDSQLRLQKLIVKRGFYPNGESLTGVLSKKALSDLDLVAGKLKTRPVAVYHRMRPWLAFTIVNYDLLRADGGDPNAGVDALLRDSASRADKTLRYFETLEAQTLLFADLPLDKQVAMLEEALANHASAASATKKMIDAWLSGDLKALEAALFADAEKLPDNFERKLFAERNANWAKELDKFMKGAGSALVVVGAGHMVGKDNLLDLMAKRGWKARRL